jgi:CheY-like chemotaxis protein
MTKIMLVEDDKSLREIYGVRLLAEGYDIVSAGDGEEALAMAIKERPQLIVSDVMMPKISGFDMLDILRSTTETKNIKVIMMTALSSEEQRQRGETLGADRYLVKSQVGIEDVVRVVHEVLEDQSGATPAATAPATPDVAPTTPPPASASAPSTPPVTPPSVPSINVPVREASTPPTPAAPVIPPAPTAPTPPPTPMPTPEPTPPKPMDTPKPASIKTRIIQPLNDPSTQGPDIGQLLDRELAKEAGIEDDAIPTVQTADQEKAALEKELASFQPPVAPQTDTTDGTTPTAPDGNITIDENGSISAPPPPPPPPSAPNVNG